TSISCLPASVGHCCLHSFPTRRSSDLMPLPFDVEERGARQRIGHPMLRVGRAQVLEGRVERCGLVGRRVVTQAVERTRKGPLARSEEHTSELQSRENLVCRLLLEKKNE